ncbi:MAG: polyprenyl synthetase family protein [Sphingomonadaceae bacterium]
MRETAYAFGGEGDEWITAAAAVELAVAAIDVVDDLIDGEWDGEGITQGRASNASQALSWLAQRAILDEAPSIGVGRTLLLSRLLLTGAFDCCGGQDLDLLMETNADVTEEAAHEMTLLKSGSLVAMACQIGTGLATDDAEVLSRVEAFGKHVGVIEQLLNDIYDVATAGSGGKSDLKRGKRTIPIAYALRCARDEGLEELVTLLRQGPQLTTEQERCLSRTIAGLGGLQYSVVVADVHRKTALDIVDELIQLTAIERVSHLRRLVPALGSSSRGGLHAAATA